MVTYVKSDLEFILQQILIAEAQAGGADPASLVPHFSLPFGLRTVDGTFNNLLPGNENFGAADTLFPRIVPSNPLNDPDGDTFDANGPAPGGVITNNNYGLPGDVADADPRIISNLLVDMTLNNPAAVAAALKYAGITGLEADAARADIDADFQDYQSKIVAAIAAQAAESAAIAEHAAAVLAQANAAAALAAAQLAVTNFDPAAVIAATAALAAADAALALEAGELAAATAASNAADAAVVLAQAEFNAAALNLTNAQAASAAAQATLSAATAAAATTAAALAAADAALALEAGELAAATAASNAADAAVVLAQAEHAAAVTGVANATQAVSDAGATFNAYTSAAALAVVADDAAETVQDDVTTVLVDLALPPGSGVDLDDLLNIATAITSATAASNAAQAVVDALLLGPNVTAGDLAAAELAALNALTLLNNLTDLQTALNGDAIVDQADIDAATGALDLATANQNATNANIALLNASVVTAGAAVTAANSDLTTAQGILAQEVLDLAAANNAAALAQLAEDAAIADHAAAVTAQANAFAANAAAQADLSAAAADAALAASNVLAAEAALAQEVLDLAAANNAAALAQLAEDAAIAEHAAAVLVQANAAAALAAAQTPLDALIAAVAIAQANLDAADGNLAQEVIERDAAIAFSDAADIARDTAEATLASTLDSYSVVLHESGSLVIPNVATDEGLSAQFNSWFTFFGQFFDHGLDLVTKGGNGTVYVPLQPDDPLVTHGPDGIIGTGDEVTNPALQFIALTRATPTDVNGVPQHENTTTSWVDQNQTYTSHASHQVFLREYAFSVDTDANLINDAFAVSTGKLIDGANGGIGNWAEVKAQALTMLGIKLTDYDVVNVPLLLTDQFGKFIPGANGYAQIIITDPDGDPFSGDETTVEGTAAGIDLVAVGALRTGHAFLNDIAHAASPFHAQTGLPLLADVGDAVGITIIANPNFIPGFAGPNSFLLEKVPNVVQNPNFDPGQSVSGANPEYLRTSAVYDDELLDVHKITGDGRGNENIALTTVHHVFHSEHNNLADHTKLVAVQSAIAMGGQAGLDFLNAWLNPTTPAAVLPPDDSQASIDALIWNGERIFQAAKFGTEMQYQHLVFEEFARKVQPLVNLFGQYSAEIDPSIVAEFAHVVYRFGHSMLTEDVARMNPDGTMNDVGLIEAFLNPVLFDASGTADEAAGAIIRGSTRQVANEIDEFIVDALRNNLLGLPLDLAVFNIARARDTGAPSLNEARAQFYAGTGDEQLKPYESWVDLALHSKNELSVVNFIAAYGLHGAVLAAVTLDDKRKAATALVLGDGVDDTVLINGSEIDISDRFDFLNSTGIWTAANTGLNDIDLWIGGLAEAQQPFGGLLGSTFNFVFETQMENLQDGDRFYYLNRLAGTHFLTELEGNSFAQMVINNTNLGDDGMHLPGDIFSVPNFILEVDQTKQVTGIVTGIGLEGREDPTGGSIFNPLVIRNNPNTVGPDTNYLKFTGGEHVVLGGTEGNDTLIASIGDDTIWGDGGNDRIEGGAGVDQLLGGAGDDIITDINGDDNIKGQGGNDVINSGDGFDLILAGDGNDFTVGGEDANETFGGEGNDFIFAGDDADVVFGDAGDDWIEGGGQADLLQGDFGAPFQDSAHAGNDVIIGGAGSDDYDSESGDDIMLADDGIERNEGMLGFDWVSYKYDVRAADADLFFTGLLPPDLDAIRDRFDLVEGLSGWDLNDTLRGDNADSAFLTAIDVPSGHNNALNTETQINLVNGLQDLLGPGVQTSFSGGNIILGGGGSDIIEGRGGDDIIDGDAKLNVRLSIRANLDGTGAEIGTADGMTTAISSLNATLNGKSLVELMFNGTLNPGQLQITREILNSDDSLAGPLGTTNAVGDIDVAMFSDIQANYTIEGANALEGIAAEDVDLDGYISVTHNVVGGDGVDRTRNFEILQFSDSVVFLDPALDAQNDPATGLLAIIDGGAAGITVGEPLTATLGTVDDVDGVPAIAAFTFLWQFEQTLGAEDWADILNPLTGDLETGVTFTPTADHALDGLRLRVIGSFNDLENIPEVVFSAPTDAVAPAAVAGATAGDDLLNGTLGADLINGLAGDDIISGLGGDDILIGGPGNDILDGGSNVVPGLGDIAVFFGPQANFLFSLNAEGVLEVVDVVAGEEDAINNIENLLFVNLGAGGTLDDLQIAALVAALRNGTLAFVDGAPLDISSITGNPLDQATIFSVAGILDGDLVVDTAGADVLVGGDWNDTLIGLGGDDEIDGGVGDDTVFGDGIDPGTGLPLGADGDDTIGWRVGDGRDLVDGGGNTAVGDTFDIRGNDGGDVFRVYAVGDGVTVLPFAAVPALNPLTQVVVTRDDGTGEAIIAELRNIESLIINNTLVTGDAPVGNDTVTLIGDFTGILNGAPTGMEIAGSLEVAENVAGAILGAVTVHDPNPVDTFTFTINDSRFEIVDNDPAAGQQLVLKLKDGVWLDYEAAQNIDLVINVFDQGGLGSANNPYDYTVNVTDVVFENLGPVNGLSILGGEAGEILNGGALDDIIQGGGGADRVVAGNGNDRFVATVGDGNDRYAGGGGIDTYDLSQTTANSDVNLARGRSSSSETGRDRLVSVENVVGSHGNNRIVGSAGDNVIDGLDGNDNLSGGRGADTLFGGAGLDILNGDADNDILVGGTGNDVMNGGTGLDTFVFANGFGNDTITGFDANATGGQDLMDISAFGFSAANFAANVVITDLGADTLVDIVGTDNTILLVGVNGVGTNAIDISDFLL